MGYLDPPDEDFVEYDDRMSYADDACPLCRSHKCQCMPCPTCGAMTPSAPNPKTHIWEATECEACEHKRVDEAAREYFATHPDEPRLCPHGEPWHVCNACMIAGDLAYDAARESAVFGRR